MNTIPNFRGIWAGRQGTRFLLYGWGYNQKTLGLDTGPTSNSTLNRLFSSPVQVSNISNWRKVILGAETVLGITDQNTMWGWGSRHLIWTGTETNSVSPVRVTTADDWLDFSFAQNSSVSTVLGIKTNGTLWAWGENARGQLGLGDTTDRSSPVQVGASGGWIAVSTSNNNSSLEGQTLAIQGTGGSGSLWAWGVNSSGELGIGNTANQSTPVRVGLLNTWAKVYSCGPCSFAIRNNRTLWAWGRNSLGVLGFGGTNRSSPVQVGALTDWVKVRSDSGSTIGLRSNGTLWGWGDNFGSVSVNTSQQGFIGINPALVFASSPVQIGSATDWSDFELFTTGSDPTILALKTTGTLWVWGSNSQGLLTRVGTILTPFNQVGALATWTKIAAGANNTFGIRSDASLWAWGYNGSGRLGLTGSVGSSVASPIRVGSLTGWIDVTTTSHTLARRSTVGGATSGSLWAWGENSRGQLGLGNTVDRSSPVQIGTDTNWSMISVDPMDNFGFSSYGHSVAIKTNGTLWAWGENADGQLGNGLTASTSSPVQVGSGSTGPWTKAACARRATIGIQQDGTMWSWGSSLFGILGRTGASSSSPIQIGTLTGWTEIKCGEDHALAKRSDGTLWSWGRNSFGELGLQDIVARSSPVQIGANTDWGKISTSIDSSFATRTDNTLWGWGENVNSVLDNSSSRKSSPVQIGTGAGWTAAEGGQNHLIALTTTGTLWARGLATNGQLGVGTFPTLVGGLTNPTQITGITASSLARNCSTLSNLKGFLKRK